MTIKPNPHRRLRECPAIVSIRAHQPQRASVLPHVAGTLCTNRALRSQALQP